MSLLNDALKQAKAAQPATTATAEGPALRPDFSPRRSRAGTDFLLPAFTVVILALGTLLLWQWFRGGHGETTVRARTMEPVQPATPTAVAPAVVSSPSPAPQALASSPQPAVMTAPQPAIAAPVQQAASSNIQPVVAAPAQPVAPPPPAFKLQSIFYRAKNPSAVINGKTLFIADRVGTAHLVAITQDSATVVTADGETKVLELP